MRFLRRFRYTGRRRPGTVRPHAAWPPQADPWAGSEDTQIILTGGAW